MVPCNLDIDSPFTITNIMLKSFEVSSTLIILCHLISPSSLTALNPKPSMPSDCAASEAALFTEALQRTAGWVGALGILSPALLNPKPSSEGSGLGLPYGLGFRAFLRPVELDTYFSESSRCPTAAGCAASALHVQLMNGACSVETFRVQALGFTRRFG